MLTMESDMKGSLLHATMPPHHTSAALHGHAASPYSALAPLMNLGQSHLTHSQLSHHNHHHHHMSAHIAASQSPNPLSSLQSSMANTLNGSQVGQQQQQQQQSSPLHSSSELSPTQSSIGSHHMTSPVSHQQHTQQQQQQQHSQQQHLAAGSALSSLTGGSSNNNNNSATANIDKPYTFVWSTLQLFSVLCCMVI